ncbi:MAG: carboxylating nicotinate-nucleotide diphosphorylase [Alphaproteobacteria bacterium]
MQRAFDMQAFLIAALQEDVGSGDITSNAVIPETHFGQFVLTSREPLVLSGGVFLPMLFNIIDERIALEVQVADGTVLPGGSVIATLSGPVRGIFIGERVALNLLQHLSGIATETRRYVEAIKGTSARITDTRKTLPGWRELQRYAVRSGGGYNHRIGLDGGILIKDNHLAIAGSVHAAIQEARQFATMLMRVEVECDTLAQVEEAIAAGADILLLDNMPIDQMQQAVARAKAARILCEASGNVTLETVRAIAETGVDVISIGRLTHSVRAVDIGMDAATS